jgi:hypothetical protein
LLVFATMLVPLPAIAERVTVPLSLDTAFIESVLREQVFTGARQSVRINDDGTGCRFLELSEPRLTLAGGRALLRTRASARAGQAIGGRCLLVLDWRGELEFTQTPVVGPDGRSLLLRTTAWRALRPDGSTDSVSTTVGQWLDQFLPPGLKETRVSFAEPIAELDNLLALMIPDERSGRARMLLGRTGIDEVSMASDRATIVLGIDFTPVAAAPAPVEPVLSDEELARLSERLDDVDAFFTYAIKTLYREGDVSDAGTTLEVLVSLRRELIRVLGERQRGGADPARALFVDAWESLAPLVRLAAGQQSDPAVTLRYLTFIGAGDALEALDRLGPSAGIEITSDGLRRLARVLIPEDPDDPLGHDDGVDPELRRTFGFGAPLPPPEYTFETSWLDWFIPSAVAATGFDPGIAKRLNSWVPTSRDVAEYLPLVRQVLSYAVKEQLRANPLDGGYHQVYRLLVFAAAWQESCWRQFVARNDKRVPVESGSGDVGMMQINPKVWRGFYDLQGLRWDIVYNARAGADILQHHLITYAIGKGEHRSTGSVDNLARAAYAAYNGGPRQYDRYRRSNAPSDAKKVDALFFEKYRAVKSRGEMAVTACYSG